MLNNLRTKAAITYCTGMRKVIALVLTHLGEYIDADDYLELRDGYEVFGEVLNEINGIEIEKVA